MLQLSQHAEAANLPAEDRNRLPAADEAPAAEVPAMSVSTDMIADGELRLRLDRIQSRALIVGGAGARRLSLAAWLVWPDAVLARRTWSLMLFWVGIALGCMGLTMLHHLVGGSWGLVVRRPMESGGMTLLPLAFLFVPLALGLSRLYPWARPEEVAARPGAPAQEPLSERRLFPGPDRRSTSSIWFVLALVLNRLSSRPGPARRPSRRAGWLQRLSGPGLALLFLTGTFSAIDWLMSLEPHWSSTIYGVHGDRRARRWRPWR